MKNKNLTTMIYGTVAVIVIAIAWFMIKNRNIEQNGEWTTYTNEELNFETKVPAGVEVEVEK